MAVPVLRLVYRSILGGVYRALVVGADLSAEVYGLMRAPPLFISMLNAISMNNLWYAVCQCVDDVSLSRRTDS